MRHALCLKIKWCRYLDDLLYRLVLNKLCKIKIVTGYNERSVLIIECGRKYSGEPVCNTSYKLLFSCMLSAFFLTKFLLSSEIYKYCIYFFNTNSYEMFIIDYSILHLKMFRQYLFFMHFLVRCNESNITNNFNKLMSLALYMQ